MVLKQCTLCGRRFTKTEHFKRHERSHTRERPYKCAVCDKTFSRSDVLFRHMKCHVEKPESPAKAAGRRSTISEGVAPQPPVSSYETRSHELVSPPHAGIPLMQILSPSNYPAPHENAAAQDVRHGSLNGLGPYVVHSADQQQQQQQQQHQTQWNAPSPTIALNNPPNSHRQPSSQNSANAATFENSISSSVQQGQTPRSDVVPGHFGSSSLEWLPQNNIANLDFHDPFQMWLFPSLGDLDQSPDFLQGYGSGTTPNFSLQETKAFQDDRQADSADRSANINKVPRERFSRLQKCMTPRPHRLMPSLWRNIISSPLDNLFSEDSDVQGHPRAGSHWGLDADCRLRLKHAFRTPAPSRYHSPRIAANHDPSVEANSGEFPPAEILDIALGLFFRRFHPTIPFIHVATFSVTNTPAPMLFAICLIGLSILGTTGATRFVSRMYPSFLQRVCADLASCTSGAANPVQQMTIFATALLALNLAAITPGKDTFVESQMLYVSLIATVQQNGLFSAADGQDLDAIMLELSESENLWKSWSRVESAKRLILGLLTLDSWYSNLLSRSPVVRSDAVSVIAPCEEALFQAKSATQWQSLIRSGKRQSAPAFKIDDLHSSTLDPAVALGYLGSSSLLALLQIQILEAYHRIMPSDPQSIGSLVPWHLYANDLRARNLVPSVLAAATTAGPATRRPDTNCTVLWHSLCIMLLSDFRNFALAAGQHGPGPAAGALENIAAWTQTVSARRACVHAAQTFKLMAERKVSDNVTVHSVTALFASALVLGLYLFMVPPSSSGGSNSSNSNRPSTTVELVDTDVDWTELGDVGFFTDSGGGGGGGGAAGTDPLSLPLPLPLQRQQDSDDAHGLSVVHHFVRFGGTVSLAGVTHHGGYEPARRVLLEFANLMDGVSGKKLRTFTQVLHIMSDDLMNVDAAP